MSYQLYFFPAYGRSRRLTVPLSRLRYPLTSPLLRDTLRYDLYMTPDLAFVLFLMDVNDLHNARRLRSYHDQREMQYSP